MRIRDKSKTYRSISANYNNNNNTNLNGNNNKSMIDKQIQNKSITSSYILNKSEVIQNKNYQINKNKQGNSLPIAYFFDAKERKKIINNMIDGYFSNYQNPQITGKTKHKNNNNGQFQMRNTFSFDKKINMNSKTCDIKQQILKQKQKIIQKQLAKSINIGMLSQRSSFQERKQILPIIQQDIELGQVKRPSSQGRKRLVLSDGSGSPTLKRQHSAGFTPKKNTSQKLQLQNMSFLGLQNQQLSFSLTFPKSEFNSSRTSFYGSQTQTVSHSCKYYSIIYKKQNVIKIFNDQGTFLFQRQVKLKNYGAKMLWDSVNFANQLIMQSHKPLIKQLYYKATRIHQNQRVHKIYIHQQFYNELFKNKSQWLRDIIIELCKQLMENENKIIVNKIMLNNICKLGQKLIRIIDWSGASIKQQFLTLDKKSIVKITEPILKQLKSNDQTQSQQNILKWICQPEYLAPQIIQGLQKGKLDDKLIWGSHSSASDIWSLGCLIVQILTLIPLDSKERYGIKGRGYNRRGFLSMPQFTYGELLRKQKLFSSQITRIVKKQCQNFIQIIDPRIIQVMQKMLQFNKNSRIQPQQVIRILSK